MSIHDRKRSSRHADSVEGQVTHYHLACHVQPYIRHPLVFQTFFFKSNLKYRLLLLLLLVLLLLLLLVVVVQI